MNRAMKRVFQVIDLVDVEHCDISVEAARVHILYFPPIGEWRHVGTKITGDWGRAPYHGRLFGANFDYGRRSTDNPPAGSPVYAEMSSQHRSGL